MAGRAGWASDECRLAIKEREKSEGYRVLITAVGYRAKERNGSLRVPSSVPRFGHEFTNTRLCTALQ